MSEPLIPPAKKNPLKRMVLPTLPPTVRSRAALGLAAAAAEGRFMLQICGACATVQYPPRDACGRCLSTDLPWKDVSPCGELLAETNVRTSPNLYFRERAPWRLGSVKLEVGPVVICHIHGDVEPRSKVTLANKLDRAGHGVMMALPQSRTAHMQDDPQLRAMASDPKHRRVLITDGRNPTTPDLVKSLTEAGAETIFVGEAEGWLPNPLRAVYEEAPKVALFPLDVTDTNSVQEAAGEIGGKVDILINNARFLRAGGAMTRPDTAFAKSEMEVNYFGMMRLAQAFGPVMAARAADGSNSAAAWVNVLSAYALVNEPLFGTFSASNAAALSLSQNLRADFRASGVRVMNLFVGPTEDSWHQEILPPKVPPATIARDMVQGLRDGLEDVYCGDVAKDMIERFRAGPKILEREMTGGNP